MAQIIYGRHPILESIKSGKELNKIYLSRQAKGRIIKQIIKSAKQAKIPIKFVDLNKLEKMAPGANHQGIVGERAAIEYQDLNQILKSLENKKTAIIVLLDRVKDPHNLGAIIRSSYALGAEAVIIPKRESAPLTDVVYKTSAGAVEHISVIRVNNLVDAIKKLKDDNFWIFGADAKGKNCFEQNLKSRIALVLGSESKGLRRLVKERCDLLLSVPIKDIDSLNVSCAASILLYEARRQIMSK